MTNSPRNWFVTNSPRHDDESSHLVTNPKDKNGLPVTPPVCQWCNEPIPRGDSRRNDWMRRRYCSREHRNLAVATKLVSRYSGPPKHCAQCNVILQQRPNENNFNFAKRKYCSQRCTARYGRQVARAKPSPSRRITELIAPYNRDRMRSEPVVAACAGCGYVQEVGTCLMVYEPALRWATRQGCVFKGWLDG